MNKKGEGKMAIKHLVKMTLKQIAAVVLLLVSIPAHALFIGNISGTFDTVYGNNTPIDTDAVNFLSPLLGGAFQGSYTLSTMPTPSNWPTIDSWDISFFDASMNLVSTTSSSDTGSVGYFHDSHVDYLLFYNSLGPAPYLQLAYPDNFVGTGDNVFPSFVGWYDGSTGGLFGDINVVSGSSVISSVSEPSVLWLIVPGLIGLLSTVRRNKS